MRVKNHSIALVLGLVACTASEVPSSLPNSVNSTARTTSSYAIVHSFQGPPADGWVPVSGLLPDAAGRLYGVTNYGGSAHSQECTHGCGTFFMLDPSSLKETILYSFGKALGDGELPNSLLLRSGSFYGTTQFGGSANLGTAFVLSPPAHGKRWKETVLYSFRGPPDDGSMPIALTLDSSGSLYGPTWMGGSGTTCLFSSDGCGAIFKLTPPSPNSEQWHETMLHSFAGAPDGAGPNAQLVLASDGTLYGETAYGGRSTMCPYVRGCGTVFALKPRRGGSRYVETIVHSFNVGQKPKNDGSIPGGALIQTSNGTLYGTTAYGGGLPGCDVEKGLMGCGTIFALHVAAGERKRWRESVLYAFKGGPNDGAQPDGITSDGAGGFYGETSGGGTGSCQASTGCGTLFHLAHQRRRASQWSETILHSFNGNPSDGLDPGGALVTRGNALYGTTLYGGSGPCEVLACGTIYEWQP